MKRQAPPLAGLRVLVVDDDIDSREALGAFLGACGAEVALAASADQALDALGSVRPHVLISDVVMPYEDGYGLIRRVRALGAERGGHTPALALTAYDSETRERALDAGFTRHLSKTVDPLELARIVAELGRAGPWEDHPGA